VAVTNSPVPLTGTAIPAVIAAALTPASWTTSAAAGCPNTGTGACPTQVFTLTNNGNVPLTGIAQGALGGANPTEYTIIRATSTCGPAGNGQVVGITSLNPAASCVVAVRFSAVAPAGLKPATVSVTDAAGTQSSTLSGTVN